MITIEIGDSVRTLSDLRDVDESWVNQQINRRREDGRPVCVRIKVKDETVDLVMSTADCGDRSLSSRLPKPKEKAIFDLWGKVGMDKKDFHGGTLIAFLKQLRHIIA